MYKIRWQLTPEFGNFTREEIGEEQGACDALIFFSILRPGGAFSLASITLDGETKEPLADLEIFKVWSLMAKNLSESKTLPQGHKDYCKEVFETIRSAVLSGRE